MISDSKCESKGINVDLHGEGLCEIWIDSNRLIDEPIAPLILASMALFTNVCLVNVLVTENRSSFSPMLCKVKALSLNTCPDS